MVKEKKDKVSFSFMLLSGEWKKQTMEKSARPREKENPRCRISTNQRACSFTQYLYVAESTSKFSFCQAIDGREVQYMWYFCSVHPSSGFVNQREAPEIAKRAPINLASDAECTFKVGIAMDLGLK